MTRRHKPGQTLRLDVRHGTVGGEPRWTRHEYMVVADDGHDLVVMRRNGCGAAIHVARDFFAVAA